MSWTGFKKAVNRAGNQVFSKRAETIADESFDASQAEFERFEKLILELSSHLDHFKSNVGSIIECQVTLMQTLDSYYGEGPRDGPTQQYLVQLAEMQQEKAPMVLAPMDFTVLEPIKELGEANAEIHKLIKKRGRKKFDYEVAIGKLEKHQQEYDQLQSAHAGSQSEVTGLQVSKALEKLQKTKAEFHSVEDVYQDINEKLKTEMAQYINLRFGLLDPSFEALIKIQTKLFGDLELVEQADAMSREENLAGQLDERLDSILDNMRSLDVHNM